MDRQTARQCFDKGKAWALANAEGFSPDSRFAVLAGLLLADPESAAASRDFLRSRPKIRLSAIGKVMDLLSLGALSRRMEARRSQADPFFDILERDPSPCAWTDLDSFRHVPEGVPKSPEAMHRIDGASSNPALFQASAGRIEERVLAWLRRDDLWGYDLAHQLLAWVVCLKTGYLADEARERVGRLAWRVFHEIQHGPEEIHYDLFAERLAFLLLAGFPAERLAKQIEHVVSAQDPEDGGWWFTRHPAEQEGLLKEAHLGASPMVRLKKSYRDQRDPAGTLRRLATLHRGHAAGLSLWALGSWLHDQTASSTQRAVAEKGLPS